MIALKLLQDAGMYRELAPELKSFAERVALISMSHMREQEINYLEIGCFRH